MQVTVGEIETALCRMPDIKAARVVVDSLGDILEVHVLALPSKQPKQLVRDIESAIMAEFGIAIDHKKVSIAQLGPQQMEAPERKAPARARIISINTEVSGLVTSATVALDFDGDTITGNAQGPGSETMRQRVVAMATINALEQYSAGAFGFALEDVAVMQLGHQSVAVSCLVVVTPLGDQAFVGSALVRQSEKDSIVRATLNAINRRVGFLTT